MEARDAIITAFNRQFLSHSEAQAFRNRDQFEARCGSYAFEVLASAGPSQINTYLGIKLVKDESLNANEVTIRKADSANA